MALILSLETATPICSVALHRDGALLAFRETGVDKSHSALLSPFIEEVLGEAGVSYQDLDAVALSAGPGSYTGLRIGSSTAKGLCFALDIPLIPIPTLAALAAQVRDAPPEAILLPMLDARRMEVYTQAYGPNGATLLPLQPVIFTPGVLDEVFDQGPALFFGPGAEKGKDLLEAHPNARFLAGVEPSARPLGSLAEAAMKAGQVADLAAFEPEYLKEFQAKPAKDLLRDLR